MDCNHKEVKNCTFKSVEVFEVTLPNPHGSYADNRIVENRPFGVYICDLCQLLFMIEIPLVKKV